MKPRRAQLREIAQIYDVPPWLISVEHDTCSERLRWALSRPRRWYRNGPRAWWRTTATPWLLKNL